MEKSRQRGLVLKLCVAAVMMALVFLGSKLQIQIPSIAGFSRFHLGNIMCALSGALLGPWWGGLAAGLGSAMFDLTNPAYVAEAPITFVSKGLYALVAGVLMVYVFKRKNTYLPALLSTVAAALYYVVFYLTKTYFYNGMLLSGLDPAHAWLAVVEKLPSAGFNALVAILAAPVLAVAVRRALRSAKLEHILG